MTVAEKTLEALLRGESIVASSFAARVGCDAGTVRDVMERFGAAVSCNTMRGKRGALTNVYTARDLQALREWRPGTTAKKFRARDFVPLAEVFGIRPVKIKLPTHRHIMEGEWA
ncbi:hypothetical protein [Cupriavidus gilardii]|uniref:hypothetical protein n=1 Tax=Cupriavidus gilardii TaxID=82541 RepID=UPI0021BF2E70|nr:hypothetical protein [Cupriavidus gilardii]MCT9125389.1 hypothetical protein [Cupriavidus gilardii]